jgi:hypothetical protein
MNIHAMFFSAMEPDRKNRGEEKRREWKRKILYLECWYEAVCLIIEAGTSHTSARQEKYSNDCIVIGFKVMKSNRLS